ncbi:unnamed protein product [Leptidea sinapis]|uniref:Uncharacterized protein n=1 Tax=Leptidea sinapis TaxID=189913 RepID=A0A5E4PVA0_9NEOP|nr:unnamed protein product [Leptidea sinapis]
MFGTTGMVRSPQQATGQVAQNGSTTFPRSHHQRTGRPPAAPKSYDYLLKVLLVGDSDVGKQEILQDLEDGSADSPFCSGSAYKTTTILLDGKRVKLQLWDTSGQGRFCTIIRSYSRGAQGILLVYDITNKWSFDSIDRWLEEVEKHAPGVPKVLVGNRLHLAFKRQVQERDAELYAAKNHMAFFEVSPLCDFNILTVVFLYTSTILTTIYLICSISLLHGAVKYKRQYILPWIMAACIAVVLLLTVIILGDGYPCIIKLFGGHNMYHFGCALFILTFIYAICAVSSFAIETGSGHCRTTHSQTNSDERGERLLLLDHAAHSSLLSAAQLNKLSHGTLTHFV